MQVIEALKGKNIKDISAGKKHAAAIDSSFFLNPFQLLIKILHIKHIDAGAIFTWGFNFYDQLGLEEGGKESAL
jgi:hypothetical protein